MRRSLSRRRLLGFGILAGAAALGLREVMLHRPDYAGEALAPDVAHRRAQSGDILLVDIRRPDEWHRTGIGDGAHPLDMRRDDFTQALEALAEGDRNRPIALICARGVRSARMANRMTEAGFGRIIDVPEGMEGSDAGPGWIRRGLPVREHG